MTTSVYPQFFPSQIFLPRILFLMLFNSLVFGVSSTGGVILQYHHVHDTTAPITSISIDRFREHMDYLVANEFQVWRLERLVQALKNKTDMPDKVVSITFDDAYVDLYEDAFPVLLERNLSFTIFVTTGLIGKKNYVSWAQLKEMQLKGATIANHTHSHTHLLRKLNREADDQWQIRVRQEIEQAQEVLNRKLGNIPRLLAYPYGEYNHQILKIVADLDYVGFGQQSGAAGQHSPLLLLPRFPLSGIYTELDSFRTKLLTRPMPLIPNVLEPLQSTALPELVLHFESRDVNLSQLTCYGPGGLTQLQQIDKRKYLVTSAIPIPVGRSRYNCTLPTGEKHRFYWFSQLWIRKKADGSWYPEP